MKWWFFPIINLEFHQFHYGEWISQSEVITEGTPQGGENHACVKMDEF